MALTRTQLEALDPRVFEALATQVGAVHAELTQQANSHEQIWRDLDEAWQGTAALSAGDGIDSHMRRFRANAEGAQQLQTAFTNAATDLVAAKKSVIDAVALLEADGYKVRDDWSIEGSPETQSSAPSGNTQSATVSENSQNNKAALQGAINAFNYTEQLVGKNIEGAYANITPVDFVAPQNLAGNWDTDCHINGKLKWEEFTEEQKNNARDIYAVGRCMGATEQEIQLALMTALLESRMYNLGDPSMNGSEEKADGRNGKKCMGHTDESDKESGGGLFQQHPFDKQGHWGTTAEIMDPVQAATMFYQGRCTPSGVRADGIWTYTRGRGIAIDPSAESQYLYEPTQRNPDIKVADGSPKSAPPWAIAQAIQRPSMLEANNGAGNFPSYKANWDNAANVYSNVAKDQAAFTGNADYCSVRQGRVDNIMRQNTCP